MGCPRSPQKRTRVPAQCIWVLVQKCTPATRLVRSLLQAPVRILWHTIAFGEAHSVVAFEFFQYGSCVFGCFRLSRFQYPVICGAIASNTRCPDAFKARNRDLSETSDFCLG